MKNSLLDRMTKEKDSYGYSHRHLAQYIITHPDDVPNMTISALSKAAYCSPSSVSRLINKLGFDSYYAFCLELKSSDKDTEIDPGIINSFKKVDDFFVQEADLINNLLRNFVEADKVFLFATGSSIVPALDFERKYRRRFDKKITFSPLFEEQYKNLEFITDNDLILIVSNSGESRELIQVANNVKQYTIITNRKNSKLAKNSTSCISLENHIEALNDFKDLPRESKYSLLYFFDLLFNRLVTELEA